MTLNARAETPVIVRSDESGCVILETHGDLVKLFKIRMARDIAKITLGRSLYVLRSNFSDRSIYIPKAMAIARTVDVLDAVRESTAFYSDPAKETQATVDAIPLYCKDENWVEQMARRLDAKRKVGENVKATWRILISFYGE